MKLCSLLLLCGLLCLGQGVEAKATSAHNVQRRSFSSKEKITVKLQMEVDAPEPWSISVGDSVTIRCSVSSDSDMERAKNLKLSLSQVLEESAMVMLDPDSDSKGLSYTMNPVTMNHRGLYSCESYSSDPQITVENAYKLIWVNDTSPTVSLKLLRVNRVKYFYDKTFTIGCEVPNDGSLWRIFRASEKPGRFVYDECPNQKRLGNLVTCTIPSLPFPVSSSRRYDPYWCEASSLHKSNVLNMTEMEFTERSSRDFIVNKFDLTPAWFVREGDSVTFLCEVRLDKNNNKEKFDLQLLWTKLNPANDITVFLSQKASTPINYTLTNITHEHSGVYSCWDDGTLSNIFAMSFHHFVWVIDDSPPVTIDVLSHNRTMFFHNEEMTVGCQLHTDQSQWKIKSVDEFTGIIKECERSELSPSGILSCTVKMGYPWADHLFWCESTTGLKSNALNITNTVGNNVLEAPTLPVMEGDDITLRCLQKNKTTGKISVAPAFFKFNDITFEWSDDGSHTLKNVTKAKEGFYNCRVKNDGATLKTFITVQARPQEQKKTE